MIMYLERCDVCRSYRPVMATREGKSITKICYSCAVILGRVKVGEQSSSSVKRGKESIQKVVEELSKT